jgi:hypothetical protein
LKNKALAKPNIHEDPVKRTPVDSFQNNSGVRLGEINILDKKVAFFLFF